MTGERFTSLIKKFQLQQLSPIEHHELMDAIRSGQHDRSLKEMLLSDIKGATTDAEWTPEYEHHLLQGILYKEEQPVVHRVHFLKTAWFRYAAAILLLIGAGTFFWLNTTNNTLPETTVSPAKDIAPGHDGAILTLADGSTVLLDSMPDTLIAHQNGSQILLKNGQLAYQPIGKPDKEIVYNIVSTPKGRQFKVMLPDGSQAWLNAASSLRYPAAFTGTERSVEMTGEVYFEVAKNKKMPFRVNIDHKAQIEVLGTHFNVKAYTEESLKATLLEGSVRVSADKKMQVLEPGQQAQLTASREITINDATDINQVMAWKNGLFNFKGYDIRSMMNEIGRWYNLDIVYEAEPRPRKITGEMQRNFTLSQTMLTLKKLKINYKLEGRQLIITAP